MAFHVTESENSWLEEENENEQIEKIASKAFGQTLSLLESRDGWGTLDIPKISEEELLKVAEKNGLNDDKQTRKFITFVSTASNFASKKFKEKLQCVPKLVQEIIDLTTQMKKEIKEFANIAADFEELIFLIVKMVDNTKHNLNMIKPYLEESKLHFNVLADASKNDSLNDEDKEDCTEAFTSLHEGINKLQEWSKVAKKESEKYDITIKDLKKKCGEKIDIVDGRIKLGKFLHEISCVGSFALGVSIISGVLSAPIGFGTMCLAVAVSVGAELGLVGIYSLIQKLWNTHQVKALEFLQKILSHLNKIQAQNIAFMQYMNRSEEKTNAILTEFTLIEKKVINGSRRYRQNISGLCIKARESTEGMIKIIDEIDENIDMTSWTSYSIKTGVNKLDALARAGN